jgi:glycerophosphoryl diester phosphodiesterase
MVWTCNDPHRIERLITTGVTGIISDYLNRVRRVLDHGGAGENPA